MNALRKSRNLVGILAFLFVVGCASKTVKPTPKIPETPQTSNPQTPTPTQPTQPTAPPPPPPAVSLRVGLVLGGAGVASFATVGLLKRFHQEGVKIEFIVATGWPALFALGEGFLKSVHDLEWFAMRLKPNEFFGTGLFDFSKDFSAHDKLSAALREAFKAGDLKDASVPLIFTASPLGRGGVDVFTSGNWEAPLLKAMSVPGIYRPYPPGTNNAWVASLNGLDVKEALKRRETGIVAVDMYEDYLNFLTKHPLDNSGPLFRSLFASQLRENRDAQLALTPIRGKIVLNANPNELDRRREAILAGFREGTRLITELRRHVGE